MYTASVICSFGREFESVLRNKFLDSPVLQDEHQVLYLLEDSSEVVCDGQVAEFSKISYIFVEGIVN